MWIKSVGYRPAGKHPKWPDWVFNLTTRCQTLAAVVGWLVGFVALRPKSTAMVIAGRSVHLTTLFPGQTWTSGQPVIVHILSLVTVTDNNPSWMNQRKGGEIISWSISTKVWDRVGIELATPGSAVRHASVARHVTDCATRPGRCGCERKFFFLT